MDDRRGSGSNRGDIRLSAEDLARRMCASGTRARGSRASPEGSGTGLNDRIVSMPPPRARVWPRAVHHRGVGAGAR